MLFHHQKETNKEMNKYPIGTLFIDHDHTGNIYCVGLVMKIFDQTRLKIHWSNSIVVLSYASISIDKVDMYLDQGWWSLQYPKNKG